jgi:tetratricopeptide (TPR) repeat protein/DNA-binding XRE family transcriptional regulator
MTAHSLPNELLKYERERRNWTQGDVAEKIGAPDPKMVGKWERGITTPQSQYVRKLAELFEKSARELGITRGVEIPFWNVPYRLNPFFTGREDILARLHKERTDLKSEYSPRFQAQAICGLGGVGKTQTAVEYAYRYRDQYQAVLWVRADTREVLASDFASLAVLLNLPEKNEQHQHRVMLAVKSWLASLSRWLLIFDNADELQSVNDYIPSPCQGHLLLTTRTCVTGNLAQSISIDTMEPEEGAYFLLRRARMIELQTACEDIAEATYNQARTISQILGGLPLALDQAGAYIEETRCSLPDYLHLYETQRGNLLRWRGEFAEDHPAPVATTWALSFDKIRQANPFAIELLRLCAFLAPDAIPEEILTVGAPDLGPALQAITTNPFKLDVVFKELLKFSLIRRDPAAKTLTIHRLVQTVLRDRMDQDTQRQWAERAVKAVCRVFPNVEFATWPFCQRYLPHAQSCAELIKQWGMQFPEAIQLLDLCGQYLYQRAQYAEAEALYLQALELREQALGPEHPDVAISLSNLTTLYWDQGKFMQVEPLFLRALAVRTQALGPEHPDVASSLNDLALLYKAQDRYDQAEPLFLRALAIREKALDPEHLDMTATLHNLAMLYCNQDRFPEAEPLFLRALSICERVLGPEHPDVATSLNYLAGLYHSLARYTEAEPLFLRALSIREQALGPEHPDVAISLNNIALLYSDLDQFSQSEPRFLRALAIYEKVLGPQSPNAATILNNLALLYYSQQMFDQSESLFQRALTINERTLGPEHPQMAIVWQNYACLLQATARYDQAAEFEARASALWNRRTQNLSTVTALTGNTP